jgi:hypothetical protein
MVHGEPLDVFAAFVHDIQKQAQRSTETCEGNLADNELQQLTANKIMVISTIK